MGGRVFISYARRDAESWVQSLREYLTERQVPVWWDRLCMESRGRTFLQELRDAIHDAERVLVVITPAALVSEYVRVEWEHALLYSRAVLPLLRLGTDADIPVAYRLLHRVDCREPHDTKQAFEEILRLVRTPVDPLGPLHGVPPLPPGFVPRGDLFDAVASSVTGDLETAVTIQPNRQITVLRGMPGTGKSVLATAFARARATRTAFPDGVVQIPAGKTSTASALLRAALTSLGVAAGLPDDEPTLTALLQQRLEAARVLLILDDVWDQQAEQVFRRALGLRTRMILTTRDAGVAAGLQAKEIVVDVLDGAQATRLLASAANVPETELPPQAAGIVEETGRLPLSLAIVGAMLRQFPDRWPAFLERLQQARIDRIEARIPEYPDANLARVVAISLDDLPAATQDRFLDLAVLPDPPRVPRAVLEAWWTSEGMDPIDAEDVLDILTARSLLRRDALGVVSLHDLCVDYARRFNRDLGAVHARVVSFYMRSAPAGLAAHPADGYLFEHIGHHLEGAGKQEDLLRLVLESPAWLSAKSHAVRPQSDGLDDIDRALRWDVPEDTRAALHMAAQVWRTGAALWSPEDLATLVRLGRTDEALQAAALRSQDPFAGYLRLAQTFADRDEATARDLLQSAVLSARLEPSPWKRAAALTQVSGVWRSMGKSAAADDVLGEAIALARVTPSDSEQEDDKWPLGSVIDSLVDAKRDDEAQAIAGSHPDELRTLWSALATALARRGEVDAVDALIDEHFGAVPSATHAAYLGRIAGAAPPGAARQRWLDAGVAGWRTLQDPEERFQAAHLLLLPAHQDGHSMAEDLREVHRTYPTSNGSWSQVSGETAVRGLGFFGDLEGAKELASQMESASMRGAARFRIVQALLHAGEIEEAIPYANEVESISDRAEAYSRIASELARRNDARAAEFLEHASRLYTEGRARTHLFDAALHCARAVLKCDRDTGRRLLRWIAGRLDHLPPDFDFSTSLADFSRICFAEGLLKEGAAAMANVTNDVVRAELVEQLALDQAKAGDLNLALAVVDTLDDGWRKEAARAEVWILSNRWNEAAPAVDAISRDYNRIVERAHLASAIKAHDAALSAALFVQAEEEVPQLQDDMMPESLRTEARGEIVAARLACGDVDEAWATIDAMQPSKPKVQAALRFAEAIWRERRDEAVSILESLLDLVGNAGDDEAVLVEDLAWTLIRCGADGDAMELVERLSALARSAEHRARISRLYAALGEFENASREILSESVDLYAAIVANWADSYEGLETGLAGRVLAEITRIAGWFRDDWRQVHEIIAVSRPPTMSPSTRP